MNGVAVLNERYHYILITIFVNENHQETDNISKDLKMSFYQLFIILKKVNQTLLCAFYHRVNVVITKVLKFM